MPTQQFIHADPQLEDELSIVQDHGLLNGEPQNS
jgi:hypothetical protein